MPRLKTYNLRRKAKLRDRPKSDLVRPSKRQMAGKVRKAKRPGDPKSVEPRPDPG